MAAEEAPRHRRPVRDRRTPSWGGGKRSTTRIPSSGPTPNALSIVGRYVDHPAIIGYQVDNEPGLELFHNRGSFDRFLDRLRGDGDVETLNREWGLTYWSHRLNSLRSCGRLTATGSRSMTSPGEGTRPS